MNKDIGDCVSEWMPPGQASVQFCRFSGPAKQQSMLGTATGLPTFATDCYRLYAMLFRFRDLCIAWP